MRSFFSRPYVLLATVALVFFYLTAWLGTPPGDIWNSPDETANAFWAERVSEREPLILRDFAVGIGHGVVHPRSFNVYGTALVPGSFPGIFLLYGALKFFTTLPLSVMTPVFTAFAGLVLFALFRRIFDRKTAFWSAVLFYLHPAVLYYSGRGLFHNMLFVDLLIFAVGLFALRPFFRALGASHWIDDALAGIVLGFAVITRASEAPWVLLAAPVLLLFLGNERWKRAFTVIGGGLLPLFILLSFNATVHGSLLASGYVAHQPLVAETEAVSAVVESAGLGTGLLPFGFHPRLIVLHGMDYGLGIFWWYSIAGVLGLVVFLSAWKSQDRKRRAYLLVAGGITVWLLIFYGSWYVRDRFDPDLVTIGTSYVRYFLPIYAMTLPWVAGGLLWISERLRLGKKWPMPVIIALIAFLSLSVSVARGDESLLAVRETLRGNLEKRALLLSVIPSDATIMTERFDKVLFPDRMRIIPSMDRTAFEAVPILLSYTPVYWYGVAPSEEQVAEWTEMAAGVGADFIRLDGPIEGEGLFQFVHHESDEDIKE